MRKFFIVYNRFFIKLRKPEYPNKEIVKLNTKHKKYRANKQTHFSNSHTETQLKKLLDTQFVLQDSHNFNVLRILP